MATPSICANCFRALRNQTLRELRQSSQPALRSFRPTTTARLFHTIPNLKANESKRHAPPASKTSDPMATIAANLRAQDALNPTTEPYVAYGSTEELFRACASQADYTIPSLDADPPTPAPKNAAEEDVGQGVDCFWYRPKAAGGLGLEPTFNMWAQITFLYMYALTTRMRGFPAEHAPTWHQHLIDHFFYAAEDRMATWHGMSARGTRNKYLKDLWQQWRGVSFSYDEGLIRGDAVLAAAVWRNVFKADAGVDLRDVTVVTAFLRSLVRGMQETQIGDLAGGKVEFTAPDKVGKVLGEESRWMKTPFEEGKIAGEEKKI